MTPRAEVLCIGVEPSGLGVGARPELADVELGFTVATDRASLQEALAEPTRWDALICPGTAFYDLGVDRALAAAKDALDASLIMVYPPTSALSPAEAARRGAADCVMHGDREHLQMVLARELATAALRKELRAIHKPEGSRRGGVVLPKISDHRPNTAGPEETSQPTSQSIPRPTTQSTTQSTTRPTPKPTTRPAAAGERSPAVDVVPAKRTKEPDVSAFERDDRHIKQLIDAGGLTLEYQPIVPLNYDGARQGAMFEALLRLRDENGELLAPGTFFPAAGRHQWLGRLDLWVFRRALPILARIQTSPSEATRLFINLSTETLAAPMAIDAIIDTIAAANIQQGSLTVEIKRDLLALEADAFDRLKDVLRKHGHGLLLEHVSLDDTALLQRHADSLTHIKLEPNLIQDLASGAVSDSELRTLIEISRDHGLNVIALAVDNADILPSLYMLGVDAVQGYFISRPYKELVYPDVFNVDVE